MGDRKTTGPHPKFLTDEHEVVDLTQSDELPSELLERYDRRFESGVRDAVVRTPRTRPAERRHGVRKKIATSRSASDGWAARWLALSDRVDKYRPDDKKAKPKTKDSDDDA